MLRRIRGWRTDSIGEFKTITLEGRDESSRSRLVAATMFYLRHSNQFTAFSWPSRRQKTFRPVFGPRNKLLFSVEAAAAPLLGVTRYGVSLVIYGYVAGSNVRGVWISIPDASNLNANLGSTLSESLRVWEEPNQAVCRLAYRDANIPQGIIRNFGRACGTVSCFRYHELAAEGEERLFVQPEVEYVYQLEATAAGRLVPMFGEGKVQLFTLFDVEHLRLGLALGWFRPRSALVLLDFLIRHGFLNEANEADYAEISYRLHRNPEFPTR